MGPDVGVDLTGEVAHLAVEGRLPIPAPGEVERHIAHHLITERIGAHRPLRLPGGVDAGSAHGLAVEGPMVQPCTGVQFPFAAVAPRALPRVLQERHQAAGGGAVFSPDHVLQQDLLEGPVVGVGVADVVFGVRHDVAGAVHELPLIEGVVDDLVAGLDAPLDEVGFLGAGEGAARTAREHGGLQVVAGVV